MNNNAESPQHVAVIMDGNGRWARSRGLPRPAGHRASVKVVRKVVEECARRKVEYLTLFAISSDAESMTTSNTGVVLLVALGYGGRWDVTLIRTSGEQRVSYFLLWNLAYAEMYFSEVLWPEFDVAELEAAFDFLGHRERRFGKTSAQLAVKADA